MTREALLARLQTVAEHSKWTVDGCLVGTDGYCALIVPGYEGEVKPPSYFRSEGPNETVRRALACNVTPVDGDAFREFVGHDDIPDDCNQCDGTGEIECSECGHEADCRECDGTGYADRKDRTSTDLCRPAFIAGQLVDRNRLARVVDWSTESQLGLGAFEVDHEKRGLAVVIVGEGWRGVIMGMQDLGVNEDAPRFEVLP